MLGLDFDLNHAADVAIILGAIVLGAGYLLGQWRRGRDEGRSSALAIAESELDLLKASRDRMAGDLRAGNERITKLEAIVEQLQRENAALRELVMLETIPPALQSALEEAGKVMQGSGERLHEATRARIVKELNDTEARLTALIRGREG